MKTELDRVDGIVDIGKLNDLLSKYTEENSSGFYCQIKDNGKIEFNGDIHIVDFLKLSALIVNSIK